MLSFRHGVSNNYKGDRLNFSKAIVMENLFKHVEYLSVKIGERHLWKEDSLRISAEYIESVLSSYGYSPWRQTYSCYGKNVFNVIVEKEALEKRCIIVGAHYDTVPGTPGADDNASAVSVLLELSRLLKESPTKKALIFSAFVNEEPPCFGFSNMGSMVYAKYLRERKIPVEVMISLEMTGYFTDKPIQNFPLPGMGLIYPRTGNFIGIVGNLHSYRYVFLIRNGIRKNSNIDSRSLVAPEFFGGINLSDNYSFWHHRFKAIMITDTSFFRNKNYHQDTDTIETLNFKMMAELVKGLYYTLASF